MLTTGFWTAVGAAVVGIGVAVAFGSIVGVSVGTGVLVGVLVGGGVNVGVSVAVAVAVGVKDAVAVRVGVGVSVGVAVSGIDVGIGGGVIVTTLAMDCWLTLPGKLQANATAASAIKLIS